MKKTFLVLLLLGTIMGCRAQDEPSRKDAKAMEREDENKPKVDWKVNKQYDDKGNLVRYDSTYSWSYSGKWGAESPAADSIMNSFKKHFGQGFPSFFGHGFTDAWSDSSFYQGFMEPGYLLNRLDNSYSDMEEMMHTLDSIGNSFFGEPDIVTKPKS